MPVRVYLRVDGTRAGNEPGVFEYRLSGGFPVDRVNLVFDQANSMAEATVESRPDPKAQWVRLFSGLFYRIDTDQGQITSAPQNLPLTINRYWRLTVNASDSTIGNAVPQLEVGYRPHDLFFIARGRGPFTLAYGSAAVAPLRANVAALFDGISRQHNQGIERWITPDQKQIVLGGPQRLLAPPKPLPTRRIVLWSVLVAGVLVVAGMAWRLARRMVHTG